MVARVSEGGGVSEWRRRNGYAVVVAAAVVARIDWIAGTSYTLLHMTNNVRLDGKGDGRRQSK